MHPGAWLIWAACGGLVAVSTTNPFYLIPLFAAAWLVHSARRVDHPASRSFRVFVIFGIATIGTRTALVVLVPGDITVESVAAAALEGLRLAVMLAIFGTFNSVSDPYGVLRLAPRRFHEPALVAALALSIAPRTIEAAGRVREAQKMRGMDTRRWRTIPALIVPVLETGMEEALTLAESMDARGHGRGRRSRYRPDRWDLAAALTALTSLGALAVYFVSLQTGSGGLSVSTFPLAWPQASLALVAAAFAFTVPAFLAGRNP